MADTPGQTVWQGGIAQGKAATPDRLLAQADGLLAQRRPQDAQVLCLQILGQQADNIPARLILARARQMLGDWQGMFDQAEAALALQQGNRVAMLMLAEACISLGRIADARMAVAGLVQEADSDAALLARSAEIATQIGDHAQAMDLLRQASALAQGDPAILYNLASAEIANGALDEAEVHLDEVIARHPGDGDAFYNRATLRRQTAAANHVAELEAQLSRAGDRPAAQTAIGFALAKELEDLGQHESSFATLAQAAAGRRSAMRYRVEGDIETMEAIADAFTAEWFAGAPLGDSEARPIFVLGLPRSGTTLVERIISSHPDVRSVGEVHDLPMAITRLAAPAAGKLELVANAARMDLSALGRAYWRSVSERARHSGPVVDKTPLNFLYAGLILAAMPNARIVHVERDPMDVGYAMFKTLFRMGYPFSYDLEEIGRYILAKRRLMDHWRAIAPGRIIEISYEQLVAAQERESRRLIDALDLAWNDACLDFHASTSPSATASAAQVRSPIYRSSVGKWHHYEQQLQPLRRALGL